MSPGAGEPLRPNPQPWSLTFVFFVFFAANTRWIPASPLIGTSPKGHRCVVVLETRRPKDQGLKRRLPLATKNTKGNHPKRTASF